ncbi:hypothetical protein [Sandaracinus amylolyticus]|uniref:hypothetical protein n=1 Tax=Sandaracinus amylolyticus TaxID=927083 RepID=UPI00069E7601|nr:hypothetical protein [Sandaracinus amylolyticus]
MRTCFFALFVLGSTSSVASAQGFPSFESSRGPPPGYTGQVFELQQDYPDTAPPQSPRPWDAIDFRSQPAAYLRAVLDFALEGTVDNNGLVARPGWFHAPWMTSGCNGREFSHGLTRELASGPRSVHPQQDGFLENWAVSLYDERGGYTIGRVWSDPNGPPAPQHADFPTGATAIKFLFTTATPAQVPYLEGSIEIEAHVYPDAGRNPCTAPEVPRQMRTMRLLQVDVAVADDRATDTGWVFGTFIYDGAQPAPRIWDRLVPVAVAWDNESEVTSRLRDDGAFVNPDLTHGWVNADLLEPESDPRAAFVLHFGLGGRANGPVDNPISSCLSCHARAATVDWSLAGARRVLPTVPPGVGSVGAYPIEQFAEFFGDVPPGFVPVAIEPSRRHLDYSLQLAVGIRNYCNQHSSDPACRATSPAPPPSAPLTFASAPLASTSRVDEELARIGRGDEDPWRARRADNWDATAVAQHVPETSAHEPPQPVAEARAGAHEGPPTTLLAGILLSVLAAIGAAAVRARSKR